MKCELVSYVKVIAELKQTCSLCNIYNYSYHSVGIVMEYYWTAEKPKERPNFSKLVDTISLILEAAAGYMEFSMSIKDEHPLAAKAEVKTRESGSNVQSSSEKEGAGQQETAM